MDTSDIPPLDEDFFVNAELRMPKRKTAIIIRLDSDVVDWFKAQGKGYQTSYQCCVAHVYERTEQIIGLVKPLAFHSPRDIDTMKPTKPFWKHRRIPLPRQRGGPHEIWKRKKRYKDQTLRREMEEVFEDIKEQRTPPSEEDPQECSS